MVTASIFIFLGILLCSNQVAAFLTPLSSIAVRDRGTTVSISATCKSTEGDGCKATSRRSFVEDTLRSSCSLGISLAFLSSSPPPAYASGGATAGGAYLLSAKQRYNERVLAGTKAFLNLDEQDIGQVKSFIESPDVGGWEDYSAAGYLLSNAFRTNSNKAPDSLPSVKAWKAFAKEIELLKRAVSKKDGDKVLSVYMKAEEKLDAYLSEVELPSGMELKQM